MKKLLVLAVVFLAPMASQAQGCLTPLSTAVDPETPVQLLEELEQGLFSPAEPKAGGTPPSWCANRSDSYCTYAWQWTTRCCYPTYISPGAYCPTICE